MFSVEPCFSVEVSKLSGRLRNSAVGAGLAAGSSPSKACTLGLENPNPNPILRRWPSSFSCRSCFVLQSAGVVGGSWVCGSSADILPILLHTSGSGPSGAALFMQPPLRAAAPQVPSRQGGKTTGSRWSRMTERGCARNQPASGSCPPSPPRRARIRASASYAEGRSTDGGQPLGGESVPWLRPDRRERHSLRLWPSAAPVGLHAPHSASNGDGRHR